MSTEEPEDFEYQEDINYDNLSTHVCSGCGKRLLVDEYQKWEDSCEECMFTDTAGLIDYED